MPELVHGEHDSFDPESEVVGDLLVRAAVPDGSEAGRAQDEVARSSEG